MSEALEKNYEYFKKHLPELLKDKTKKGKIVLIKDQEFIGFYDSIDTAIDFALKEKKFELGLFSVQKVEKQEPKTIFRAF